MFLHTRTLTHTHAHTHSPVADGLHAEGGGPVVVDDGEADVAVGVDVRVDGAVVLPQPPPDL